MIWRFLDTLTFALFASVVGTFVLLGPLGLMMYLLRFSAWPSAPYLWVPAVLAVLATTYAFIAHRRGLREWPRWSR